MDNSEIKFNLINAPGLTGNLQVPAAARGLVIFAHGSGSSRLSPRNQYVAGVLNQRGIATLLTDLLTPFEDELYENRFNIDLLGNRLVKITEWCFDQASLHALSIGYFGASTGAAAALQAAALLERNVSALVSRGGRPDLAKALPMVAAPTLLIVGSLDIHVIELNKQAFDKLKCAKELEIVSGASHLFEEPGTLDKVAVLAADWFEKYL
jgi:pimeloyl-ACP methyl ester carboxylesterase